MLVLNSAARGMMDAGGFLQMVCDQTSHSPLGKMPIYCSLSAGAFVKHRPAQQLAQAGQRLWAPAPQSLQVSQLVAPPASSEPRVGL